MECEICYSTKNDNNFVKLPCNHSLCNECFPKLINGKCPFCRHQFSNTNERYYNEMDEEFDLEIDIIYYSEDEDQLTSRQRRRRRRDYNTYNNVNSRQRNITSDIPLEIFIFDQQDTPNQEQEQEQETVIYHNTKNKRVFKNNNTKRNKKNNRWNQLRLQQNIPNSY
jgi:hypothetical protein